MAIIDQMPPQRIFAFAILFLVVACAGVSRESVKVITEAKGSSYFSLGAPAISKTDGGQLVAGRVCRLGRSTLLSPPGIRVEHRRAGGQLIETAHAYLPEIYLARDQNCADYAAKVSWTITPGDIVRACFDRGNACPAQAESKAVTKAPSTP
ncbi:MAG: hypothetical protein BGN95_03035 [Sphingomonas sp. 66-10]|uniref:hypothetical protein n=1 Tax=Sphingomonas sp. 66-10 TaxID=1895848 RepID=UPI0009266A20|nr:hypothetical protein [Sphingomonas sp. 66-10]OJU15092.1 MAG: hypothetical protein BGN95_03035 [Sphingomonas sp. 66-10]